MSRHGFSGKGLRRRWVMFYRERMARNEEPCRNTGCPNPAKTLAHVLARAHGGHRTIHNITLLCKSCNQEQGTSSWPHLVPLSAEPTFWEAMDVIYSDMPQWLEKQKQTYWAA